MQATNVRNTTKPSVLLCSLPWTTLAEPSLGLSLLRSILDQSDIPCKVRHLNISMLQFLRPDTYNAIANVFALNDFLFSGTIDPTVSNRQLRWLRLKTRQLLSLGLIDQSLYGGPEGVVAQLLKLRQNTIPKWLQVCAEDIAQDAATLIGFTCMFDQTVASIALAKLVKEKSPEKLIALGGYAVRSPTGHAILKSFPWIDAVCDGEGDLVIEPLARASIRQIALSAVPGILYRSENSQTMYNMPPPLTDMNSSPVPNFSDFFDDIQILSKDHKVDITVEYLPIENSRGCWWGAKSHCVFCGIRDDDLVFRAKDASKVLDELKQLSRTYGMHSFRFSDYIFPHQYYRTLLPELARSKPKYRLMSEMKANVTADRFHLLADAGFEEVQPGIESFSSTVLKKMAKGVTGIQNIHTLLLGKRNRVCVHYNLLYGFPDDKEEEYQRLVSILPHLKHLDPPATRIQVQVTRYAPLHADPERFGIGTPHYEPSYELIFSEDYLTEIQFDLDQFCYYFDQPYQNSLSLQHLYEHIDAIVDAWKAEQHARPVYLYQEVVGDRLEIHDGRILPEKVILLDEFSSSILNMCSNPISVRQLLSHSESKLNAAELERTVSSLEESGLVFRDEGQVVSLILPKPNSHDSNQS